MSLTVPKKITNVRVFRYKRQQYAVSEIDLSVEHFEGAYSYQHGILCCLININLSDREKQSTLHKLICKYRRKR